MTTGDMDRTKRSVPRVEPWGTPVLLCILLCRVRRMKDESILTKYGQFVRYERIQEMTKPD